MNKVANFTIEFLTVNNLADGNHVYLQWGKKAKSRVVPVVGGIADFRSEIIRFDAILRKGWFHYHSAVYLPRPIVVRLQEKSDSNSWFARDRTVGEITIDFSKHTNSVGEELQRSFGILPATVIEPVLRFRITCTWGSHVPQSSAAPAVPANIPAIPHEE